MIERERDRLLLMRRLWWVFVPVFFFGFSSCLRAQPGAPDLDGYITAVSPGGVIDVQGVHLLLVAKTHYFSEQEDKKRLEVSGIESPYIGERIKVWGKFEKRSDSLVAYKVLTYPMPDPAHITGRGIIEETVVDASGTPTGVRADGYLLRITARSKLHFETAAGSLKDVGPNTWIVYQGVQDKAGGVTVEEAGFIANKMTQADRDDDKAHDFDPATIDEGDKQSGFSKFMVGLNPNKLPAHQDAELQARLDRIGKSLIPAYQRALPTSDPTKIDFRFQVVDAPQLRGGIALSNGIILVGYPAVSRLTSDSQMAAVLAHKIAMVIEKQPVEIKQISRKLLAAELLGTAGGLVVPGLGLATYAGTHTAGAYEGELIDGQSDRVSLWLMHDEGYDINEAPIAWRLLEPKKPATLDKTAMTERPMTLYGALGTTWREFELEKAKAAAGHQP